MNAPTFQQRHLTKRMTMNVTIKRPTHHRVLFWLGMKGMAVSCWLLGIGRLNVEVER
jgi:hypothetical protein